jgi:hypothetical protein
MTMTPKVIVIESVAVKWQTSTRIEKVFTSTRIERKFFYTSEKVETLDPSRIITHIETGCVWTQNTDTVAYISAKS